MNITLAFDHTQETMGLALGLSKEREEQIDSLLAESLTLDSDKRTKILEKAFEIAQPQTLAEYVFITEGVTHFIQSSLMANPFESMFAGLGLSDDEQPDDEPNTAQ